MKVLRKLQVGVFASMILAATGLSQGTAIAQSQDDDLPVLIAVHCEPTHNGRGYCCMIYSNGYSFCSDTIVA